MLTLQVLRLNRNSLTGPIPKVCDRVVVTSQGIGQLSQLVEMDFSLNNLTGEIPNEWLPMQNLKNLLLGNNNLVGSIPSTMYYLSGLKWEFGKADATASSFWRTISSAGRCLTTSTSSPP